MRVLITILACCLVAAPAAMAQSRAELLYTTHCASCHATAMHWRDNRAASDWTSLKFQVRRWQREASLAWSDGDILDVSRYLNDSIYHFEQPADPGSSLSLDGNKEDWKSCRSAAGCSDIQANRRRGSHYVPQRTLMQVPRVLRSWAQRQVEDFIMPTTNAKQPDQKRIVAALASECHVPIAEMATLCEHERAELALGAHITKYLHTFATRNVLEVLRRRDLDKQISARVKPAWQAA
jgi:hypothetical protein